MRQLSPKQIRLGLILGGLAVVAGIVYVALTALEENLVFFKSPSELAAIEIAPETRLRIGGLVEAQSLTRDGTQAQFRVTDGKAAIDVAYIGMLPDLFREGQGVVAEGRFDATGVFRADTVLAKHDETYMPPEVADALKASGNWKGAQ